MKETVAFLNEGGLCLGFGFEFLDGSKGYHRLRILFTKCWTFFYHVIRTVSFLVLVSQNLLCCPGVCLYYHVPLFLWSSLVISSWCPHPLCPSALALPWRRVLWSGVWCKSSFSPSCGRWRWLGHWETWSLALYACSLPLPECSQFYFDTDFFYCSQDLSSGHPRSLHMLSCPRGWCLSELGNVWSPAPLCHAVCLYSFAEFIHVVWVVLMGSSSFSIEISQ